MDTIFYVPHAVLFIYDPAEPAQTSCSLLTRSGRIEFSGGEPDGEVVWEGRPGWTRVTVGQRVLRDANTPDLLVVVTIAQASGEEPTVVERDGVRLSAELLETAEP